MYQAVEVVIKKGIVVPLEAIDLEEDAHYLLVSLGSSVLGNPEDVHQRRITAASWYARYREQLASSSAPASESISEAAVTRLVHELR